MNTIEIATNVFMHYSFFSFRRVLKGIKIRAECSLYKFKRTCIILFLFFAFVSDIEFL